MASSDQQLVRRALKGDERAFEELVKRFQKPIVNYIARMVGNYDLALDLSQDVFVKAFVALRTYNETFKFSSWLFKIASNTVIDHLRKGALPVTSLDKPIETEEDEIRMEVAADDFLADELLEQSETRTALARLIERMPYGYREMIVLRHINELSYEEIAEVKNLPLGTVKNRTFRAREMLRRMVEKLEGEGIKIYSHV
ncbi:MAG: sigma-70 family RNA polymerase sigma factor [Acidobacteriia bacterium]|nr:sigma-70 family RNA polymerase sigma factor [Terriglobia bacterium]